MPIRVDIWSVLYLAITPQYKYPLVYLAIPGRIEEEGAGGGAGGPNTKAQSRPTVWEGSVSKEKLS